MIDHNQLGTAVWKTLFGDDLPDDIPDPNVPGNAPLIEARRIERVEKFKKFADGYGKPLFDEWQGEIRMGLFNLITNEELMSDQIVDLVREIRFRAKMMAKTQNIINEATG
ncbi:MAG: hypothetical protein E3J94_01370 [Desulfobacteraceae bacterium]|nr:MAG: hypothetical protein E3J94_01370 [Desulfobacteraceae bacterium]